MSMNFAEEITNFEKALEEKRQALKELETRRDAHAVQTRRARVALEDLRAVLRGETPPSQRSSDRSTQGISAVPVDKNTGRPARGARREQILEICRKVGSSGEIFRTRKVLGVLREVEGEEDEDGNRTLEKGLRSYTYSLMNTLDEEGIIERQEGRGKWRWKGES